MDANMCDWKVNWKYPPVSESYCPFLKSRTSLMHANWMSVCNILPVTLQIKRNKLLELQILEAVSKLSAIPSGLWQIVLTFYQEYLHNLLNWYCCLQQIDEFPSNIIISPTNWCPMMPFTCGSLECAMI